ncbi:MAG: PsbP-related protein [Nitrososphaeraceae archaeon]
MKNKNFTKGILRPKATFYMCPAYLSVAVLSFFVIVAPLLTISATTVQHNQLAYAQIAGLDSGNATQQSGDVSTNASTTFFRYSNPGFGINLEYPSSWTALEIWRAAQAVPSSDYSGSIVSFLPPASNASGATNATGTANATGFRDNVLIGRQDANDRTLEQYTSESLEAYGANTTNLRITESTPTTIAGNPAHRIVFTENVEGNTVQKMQIWTIVGSFVYIITFGADQAEYPQFLPDVERMISTLQITPLQLPLTQQESSFEEPFWI